MTASSSSILLQFPIPPVGPNVTMMEQDGQLIDCPESTQVPIIQAYPKILVNRDNSNGTTTRCESAQMAFLSHGETIWKRALHCWYRSGFVSSLEEVTTNKHEVPEWFSKVCQTTLTCLQKAIVLKESLFPQLGLSREEILNRFSHLSGSSQSPVKALAWHPHVTKLAVAHRDDAIHVYTAGSSINPILKHKLQKKVSDLAWKPLSGSVLAVACETCVLIWHVEPTSLAIRPSSSTVQILRATDHSPVTSLAWDPHSGHLVSSSPCHATAMVWDVPLETGIPLGRNRGGGISHLSYSPDGTKLLTATTSPLFRVWETYHWQWEVWSQLTGRLTASCWSPDGRILLFAMEGESGLYAVRYSEEAWTGNGSVSSASSSILLADVSQVSVSPSTDNRAVKTGGTVSSIVWDKTGERVAVMFQPDEHGNNFLVAVFKATTYPVLELIPGGFIKGRTDESAHHIAFQPNFPDGALLSVVWSSGRVGYIPMLFVPSKRLQQGHNLNVRTPLSPGGNSSILHTSLM